MRRQRRRGHFGEARWWVKPGPERGRGTRGEVGVNPDLLHDPCDLLSTLLHEAAHGIIFTRGLRRLGSGGYYHLKSFRDVCCDELGLGCGFVNTRYGWSRTWLEKSIAVSRYDREIRLLEKLSIRRGRITACRRGDSPLPPSGWIPLSWFRCRGTLGHRTDQMKDVSRSPRLGLGVLAERLSIKN